MERYEHLTEELRRGLLVPPDERTAMRHLAAMRAAARPRRRTRWLRGLAVPAAALLALTAGLAGGTPSPTTPHAAGPMPPEALPSSASPRAETPVSTPEADLLLLRPRLGNAPASADAGPASEHDRSGHGAEVRAAAQDPGTTGRDKGAAVSEVARTKSTEHRRDGDRRPEEHPVGGAPGTGKPSGPPQPPNPNG